MTIPLIHDEKAIPMNPEVKDMWVKALESGEYSQTEDGGLRDRDDNFCCLGVLCDLAVREGVIPEPLAPVEHGSAEDDEGRETKWYTYMDDTEHATAFLPEAVMEWSGITSANAELPPAMAQSPEGHGSLTTMNDSGISFVDIATVVRAVF